MSRPSVVPVITQAHTAQQQPHTAAKVDWQGWDLRAPNKVLSDSNAQRDCWCATGHKRSCSWQLTRLTFPQTALRLISMREAPLVVIQM